VDCIDLVPRRRPFVWPLQTPALADEIRHD
jgi:hypothetical protein